LESKINIAKALIAQKRYRIAETDLLSIEQIFKETPNLVLELRLNTEFVRLYVATDQYEKAYNYSLIYQTLKDSMFGIEKREELIRLNINNNYHEKRIQDSLTFEEQKRLNEIEEAKEKAIRKQKDRETQIVFIGFIFAFILMGGIIFFFIEITDAKKEQPKKF